MKWAKSETGPRMTTSEFASDWPSSKGSTPVLRRIRVPNDVDRDRQAICSDRARPSDRDRSEAGRRVEPSAAPRVVRPYGTAHYGKFSHLAPNAFCRNAGGMTQRTERPRPRLSLYLAHGYI